MILILFEPGDPHAARLAAMLNRRGASAMALSARLLPSGGAGRVAYTPRGLEAELLRACGERVDLAGVEAVCDRRGRDDDAFVHDLRPAVDGMWVVQDPESPADDTTCEHLLSCAVEAPGAVALARGWRRGA